MNKFRRFILYLSLLIFSFQYTQAQDTIILTKLIQSQTIGRKVMYCLDDSQKVSIKEIVLPEMQAKFRKKNTESLNFGFYGGNVWVKMKLKKADFQANSFSLEIPYPPLDSIELYSQNQAGKWKKTLTGDRILYAQRPNQHRNYLFPLSIQDTLVHTYYLRVRTKGSIQLPLLIYEDNYKRIHEIEEERFYSFFFGVMLVMAFYNLFLFFPLKDLNYLLYFFYITSITITLATLSGYMSYYLPNYSVWWGNTALPFWIDVTTFFALWFSIRFLEVRKYAKYLYIFLIILLIFSGLASVITLFADYNFSVILAVCFILISSLLAIGTTFYVYFKGNQAARFFLAAWLAFLLGVILIGFRSLGVVPNNFFTSYSVQFGAMIEVLLLSFALADKINLYRKQTYQAQQATLEASQENERIIREQNIILEEKVQERTQELQEKQSEILTQNEELSQQQEEILAQRDFIEHKNKELQDRDRQIQSSIQTASTIQQAVLPYQSELEKCLKDYFVIFKPKDVVSGDFYWLSEFGNKIVLAVVDCTGHGVPGAFMSLIGNTLLDKIVQAWGICEPAQILTMLHREIQVMLRQSETRNHNGMDAIIVILEKTDNQTKIAFSGAKRPLYYVEAGTSVLKTLSGDRKSIGGIQNEERQFSSQILELSAGSMLYLASDGFADQNDVKRKKFGELRFRELLAKNAELTMNEQKSDLENALSQHLINTTQRDDILLLGFRV